MMYSKILHHALVAAPVFFGTSEGVPRHAEVQARAGSASVAVPVGSCGGDGDKKITIDLVVSPGLGGQVASFGAGSQSGLSLGNGGSVPNGGSWNTGDSSKSSTNNYGGSSSNGISNSGNVVANGGSVSGSGNSNNANSNSNGGVSINNVNNNSNNNNIVFPTNWMVKPTVTTYTYTVTNGANQTSTGTTTQTITVTVPVTTPTGSSSVGSLTSVGSSTSTPAGTSTTTTTTGSTPTPSSCALSQCALGQISASALTIVNALNKTDALIKDLIGLTDPLKGSPDAQQLAKDVGSAFADILSAVVDDIGLIKNIQPFDLGCDSTAVYYALESVLGSIEAVADLLIGSGGIVSKIPVLGPVISFGIRAIEQPVVALAQGALNLIPHLALCTGTGTPFGSYQGTIGKAIGVKGPGFCYTPSDCALGKISESAQSVVDTLDAITKIASDFVSGNLLNIVGDIFVSASPTSSLSC